MNFLLNLSFFCRPFFETIFKSILYLCRLGLKLRVKGISVHVVFTRAGLTFINE